MIMHGNYEMGCQTSEAMLEKLDDLEIKNTVRKQRGEKSIPVSPDAL
jgi:hypothetical protein